MTVAHALTVDVEDYFQVLNLRGFFPMSAWSEIPLRCVGPTRRLLDVLDEFAARATFFCLGWIAERCPDLVREIAARGHEVASHGYDHRVLPELGETGFRADLARTRDILEPLAGHPIRAFRACTWSISARTPWALPALVESGITRDSSIHPVRHPDYGMPGADLGPRLLEPIPGCQLFELPPLVTEILGRRLPLGGGGYLRLFPAVWISRALRRRERRGEPSCIYLHPWELDPGQPRLPVRGLRGFRHYVNLDKTERKLRYLLGRHRFTTFEAVESEWRKSRGRVASVARATADLE